MGGFALARDIKPTEWLLDLIYDAATDPELWRSVLTEIADLTNSQGGIIFGQSVAHNRVYFDYNGRLNEECKQAYLERHIQNPWSDAMATRQVGEITVSDAIIPLRSLQMTSFFDEVLGPQDVAHNAMVPLAIKGDFHAAFNLCRSERQGSFGENDLHFLEILLPHIQRALALCFRMDSYRALQCVEDAVLDRLAAGIILLDRRAQVIYTNAAARAHTREGGELRIRRANVFTHSAAHGRHLGALIQNALRGAASGSMSVPRSDGQHLVILVMSVRGRDIDRFEGQGLRDAAVLLYIVDPANRAEIPVALISDTYGLSPAEAKIALAISSGLSIPEAAAGLGLSPNTVKTHLRRVFSKTGTGRQAELARLLTMMSLIKTEAL
jgi:DNA-binding CsgD family transcriptional regulator